VTARRTCGLLGVAWCAAACAAFPRLDLVLVEGDDLAGNGTLLAVDGVEIDDAGRWIVRGFRRTPTTVDGVLVGSEGLLLGSGQSVGAGDLWSVGSFGSARRNNTGDWVADIVITNTGADDLSGLVFNGELILAEGEASSAPEFPAGTTYELVIGAYPTDDDRVLVVARVDHPGFSAIPYADWFDHYALIRLDLQRDPVTGAVVSFTETALLQQGGPLTGAVDPAASVAEIRELPHTTAVSPSGSWLSRVEALLTGDGPVVADSHDWTVVRDGVVVLEEGDASGVPGRLHRFLGASGLDVNRAGDVVIKTELDGPADNNDAIVINESQIVAREGDTLPVFAPYRLVTVGNPDGPVPLSDRRTVLWWGGWDSPAGFSNTGLFLNDLPVLIEASFVWNSWLLADIESGPRGFDLSDNGRYAIVEVKLETPGGAILDGAMKIDFGPGGCSSADLIAPIGELTFADIGAFLDAFVSGDPLADYADPRGELTFADVAVFLNAFVAGCP
jgi:hypothetical protein